MKTRAIRIIIFYILAVIVNVILMSAKLNTMTIFFIDVIFFFIIYSLVYIISTQRWLNILEESCDPERFLLECEKKRKLSRRQAYQNVCHVNEAVGLMALGRNDEALKALGQIDENTKGSKLFKIAYHLALFGVYLNNDSLDKATVEYEKHLKDLRSGIHDPKFIFSLDVNVLEYHYKLNKTTETAKLYLEQLDYLQRAYSSKIKKRQKLGAIYLKAELLTALGEHEEAAKKYEIVAKHGNGLWIASHAHLIIQPNIL